MSHSHSPSGGGPSADVSVRVAWADDAPAIAAVQVRAWPELYAGLLPAEVLPGSGLRNVEFTGLTVTPYIEEGRMGSRPRLSMSFRAAHVWEAGKAPAGSAPGAAGSGRSGGQASASTSGGDSKAA